MFTLTKINLTIRIDAVFSLKQKRSIIKRIKTYILSSYNGCIVESHSQDSLRYIGLTLGIISSKEDALRSILNRIIEEVELISEGFVEKEYMETI